jgi:uncharacterized protein (TIGR02466 family)
MDPVIHPIFPTAVYHANIPNISSPNPKDFKRDVLGGVNSGNEFTTNYHVLDSKQYKPLKKHIQTHIDNYVKDIVNPATQFKVDITLSHINWIPKGGFHHIHDHPNSFLSGVFYFDVDTDDGLNFHKREHNFFRIYPNQWNYYNSHQWTVKVNRGDLLIFPSSLLHSVSNVKMKQKRCTLAFNTMIKGTIGGDDLTELTLK